MLTHDLKIAADRLSTFLATSSPFLDALKRLTEWHAGFDGFLAKIVLGGQELSNAAGGLHAHISSTPSATREIDVEGFFAASNELSSLLRGLFPSSGEQAHDPTSLADELALLRKRFSTYIAHQSSVNALPLLVAASAFSRRLRSFQDDLNFLAARLAPDVSPGLDEAELSLVFHSDQTLNSFWVKLMALEDLYANLGMLLEVDVERHPLRIAKIESGSEWIQLLGHAAIVGAIGKLLVDAFKFVHRNYTTEGRIAATKQSTEQLDAIIAIIGKLDKQKADTSALKEQVATAAQTIAVNLNDLLSHESRFVIGEREVHVNDMRTITLLPRLKLNRAARLQPGGNSVEPPLLGDTSSKDGDS